jgi:16S rRNA G966 N2-methylase RsmD
MRPAGRERLGFYPLPLAEAERIRSFLAFSDQNCSALDPCIGDGAAFAQITCRTKVFRYGIELDAFRAEQARPSVDEVRQGNCFDVQCPVESFSLIYLNPPYDFELAEQNSKRMEQLFLENTLRWLKPGGPLVFVIPGNRLTDCSGLLSTHFREIRVYRLTEAECVRYKQVVVFGVRRTRHERERLTDSDIQRTKQWFLGASRNFENLPQLPSHPDHQYLVPAGAPVRMVYRGLPLDQIEDLLPKSPAYRMAAPILLASETAVVGRPLTPLHGGHVGLLCTAGMLNGVFGQGDTRHIAHWQSVKVVDRTEEEEDGATVIREKERFSNELTLVFSTGEVATLK